MEEKCGLSNSTEFTTAVLQMNERPIGWNIWEQRISISTNWFLNDLSHFLHSVECYLYIRHPDKGILDWSQLIGWRNLLE